MMLMVAPRSASRRVAAGTVLALTMLLASAGVARAERVFQEDWSAYPNTTDLLNDPANPTVGGWVAIDDQSQNLLTANQRLTIFGGGGSDDAERPFEGGQTFGPSSPDTLYLSTTVQFNGPGDAPMMGSRGYFLSIRSSSAYRSRIGVAEGSTAGTIQFGLFDAGSGTVNDVMTGDLPILDGAMQPITYQLVMFHQPSTGNLRLWVDPESSQDPYLAGNVSTDTLTGVGVRQATGSGNPSIGEIIVGTTFADVFSGGASFVRETIVDQSRIQSEEPLVLSRFRAVPVNDGATMTEITIEATGSGNDATAIDQVIVALDNFDNVYNPDDDDELGGVQTYSADNGTITFTGFSVPITSIRRFLIVYYLKIGSVADATSFSVRVTDIRVTGGVAQGVVDGGGQPLLTGATFTIEVPSVGGSSTSDCRFDPQVQGLHLRGLLPWLALLLILGFARRRVQPARLAPARG